MSAAWCLLYVAWCSGALPQLTESSQRRAERLGVAAKSLPPDLAVSAAAMDVTHTLSADKSAVQASALPRALRRSHVRGLHPDVVPI